MALPLSAAGVDDDVGELLGPSRATGAIELTPNPLCGASTDTGFDWRAVAGSVGAAQWRVVLSYTHTGTTSPDGGTRIFTSDTAEPAVQTGFRCGPWSACSATADLQWWDGSEWVTVDTDSTNCIPL